VTWLNTIALLEYHASLLADADRVDRYREAIQEVVRPGDVVVDIGTGTGLLAYFACQAGAARVFAIEEGPIVELARELAVVNAFADRVEFFHDRSYNVELPERADVLITETLWNFGVGEGMVGFLADARERLLKPGARIIPAGVELHVAPVQAHKLYAQLHDRPADRHGVSFAPIRRYQVNNVHMPHLDAEGFLSAPALLHSTELDASAPPDFEASASVAVTDHGVLHGVCGWFRARLAPGVVLHNEPPSTTSSWAHAFFPAQSPVAVRPDDEISIDIQTSGEGTVWRWRTGVQRGGRTLAAYDQSSSLGFPAGAADVAAPKTTREGEVVGWVLQAMDGTRAVAQLESDVLEHFGSRFAQPDEARRLVRDAVRSYGR
jgi:enediyne biosynthesis protein CalE3